MNGVRTMGEPWVSKYRPRRLDDMIDQKKAIEQVKAWMEDWLKGKAKHRVLILAGPPGVGKTTTVYALAREYGFEVVELNASDERTYEKVERFIQAAYTMDIAGKRRKIIFLDEADNMEESGAREIAKLIKKTKNPIIMSANHYWEIPKELRSGALIVEYRRMTQRDIVKGLARILRLEGIELPREVLYEVAKHSGGDMRAAINDLQSVVAGGGEGATEVLAYRDVEKSIFQALAQMFATDNAKRARMAVFGVDMMPNDLLLWIDENIPYSYSRPEDVARAYDAISRADIYLARAQHTGNYSLWKYAMDMMTAGVAVAGVKKKGFVKIFSPQTIKLLASSKAERTIRNSIVKKIMKEMHMSKLDAIETLRYIGVIFENDEDSAAHLTVFLDLALKEVEFLSGDPEKAKRIWGKSMNIEKKLKETGRLEESVKASAEKEKQEEKVAEEIQKADEELEAAEKEEKKGKQATLFEFLKK